MAIRSIGERGIPMQDTENTETYREETLNRTRGHSGGRAGMPLPDVTRRERQPPAHYVISSSDSSGRLADRRVVRALGWAAGDRVTIACQDHRIFVRRYQHGTLTIGSHGYLRIPATICHRLRIKKGDRLLAHGDPQHGLLVISTVDLLEHYARQCQ